MRSPVRSTTLSVAALALGLSLTLSACGGSDDSADSAPSAAATSEEPSATPSPTPTDDPHSSGIEAQGIGLAVAQYAVDNNFTNPTDQADFEAKVDYKSELKPGSKVTYQKVGAKNFQVCVVHFDGDEPTSWGIFDGASGLPTSGAGAPTEEFCP